MKFKQKLVHIFNDIEWPFIVLGAIIALLLMQGFLYYRHRRSELAGVVEPGTNPLTTEAAPGTIKSLPSGYAYRFTDGQPIPESEQPTQIYAVMIENSSDAWPLSAMSQARLVFEAQVEGSIPRFMAIFDDTQTIDQIGPVRSARPYYISWARGLNAVYVHVGGSPAALDVLSTGVVKSLNEFYWGRYFRRDTETRFAPHNVYTSTALLQKGFEARQYSSDDVVPHWNYTLNTLPENERPDTQSVSIPFSPASDDYTATWKYQKSHNQYLRFQGEEQQKDSDGSPILASNVIVMFTDISVIDELGRRTVRTEGEGEALLFQQGRTIDVIWHKPLKTDQLKFYYKDNDIDPVKFIPGATWVEVIPHTTQIDVE